MKYVFGFLLFFVVHSSSVLYAQPITPTTAPASLSVLNWWTSDSERRAAEQLAKHVAVVNIQWNNMPIPGGGGVAAVKVLKSQMLNAQPPDVAQIIGEPLNQWAEAHLVANLDAVALQDKWASVMFPAVLDVVEYKGHYVAAPIGVHRMNSLLYNRAIFAKLGITPPSTWSAFETAVAKLQAAGVQPLAWSDETWQISTVFDSVLLSYVGPQRYRKLMVAHDGAAWLDPNVGSALRRLRWLRSIAGSTTESDWTESAKAIYRGTAAMLIMGDWAKGELMAWGASPTTDFGCNAVPGTDGMHIFSVDTLAMLANAHQQTAAQQRMASVITSPSAQLDYNRIKGSIPVRRDVAIGSLDPCAQDSWRVFSSPTSPHLPSLTHRMAADEVTKDAVAEAIAHYVLSATDTTLDTQHRLANVMRAPSTAN